MSNATPQQIFEELTQGLPHFDDGRVNFTGVHKAPVLNVIVCYNNEILIVKRSQKVGAYQGLWNGISGFIDEPKSIEAFAQQELVEELSLQTEAIENVRVATPYEVKDKKIDRVWVVYPVLVTLKHRPIIILDWEHTEYAWIDPEQLNSYEYVKDFDISVSKALALM